MAGLDIFAGVYNALPVEEIVKGDAHFPLEQFAQIGAVEENVGGKLIERQLFHIMRINILQAAQYGGGQLFAVGYRQLQEIADECSGGLGELLLGWKMKAGG